MGRWLAIITVFLASLSDVAWSVELYDEQYRPQFHFSAKQGWLNDPNGLVYLDGQYHMFYQHNPFGTGWGNMSWGHATSPDLVHWTELSPAIVGDPTGVKFSGTAVIDYNNTAGLQTGSTPTMALFYTSVGSFDQRMAYSTDGGQSFRYYNDNPVLPSISHADDRDPQVFWHEDSQKWVQVVWVAGHDNKPQSFSFFGSSDLKNWSYLSEVPNYFECPDFFELPVDGDPDNTRWVLYGASGGYQVGSFDGTTFVPEASGAGKLTQDYGANFYASQSWHNIPSSDGRRIQVTWMNGANYPGMPFNQQMGIPVELTLHSTPAGVQMYRTPVAEIDALHGAEHALNNVLLRPGIDPLNGLAGDEFHITTELEIGSATSLGLNVRGVPVTYNVASQTLSVLGRTTPLAPVNGKISLELLVDRSSLEVFGNGGAVSITNGFTPSPANQQIGLFATGGNGRVVSLSAFEMRSAWPAQQPAASEGLIGRWNFNEPSLAAGFVDGTGNNLMLANSGVVSGSSGIAGNSADLNNSGDYAFIPDNSLLDADGMSVSLWFRPDSSGQAANLLSKSRAAASNSWSLEQTSDGRLKFVVTTEGDASTSIVSSQAVATGDWHHAVASYNSSLGRLELFVDGQLAAAQEGAVHGPIAYDNSPLFLGRRVVGAGTELSALDGRVDELQIYGSALTPGEIRFVHLHPDLAATPDVYVEGPLTLEIDASTGAASIINPAGDSQAIRGYSILSNADNLSVAGWQSLDDRTDPQFASWEEATPGPGALSELTPTGGLTLLTDARLDLGHPAQPLGLLPFGTAARNTQYSFEYLTTGGEVRYGSVELVGNDAMNNLVVSVDPTTGQATLTNDSNYAVGLLGYSITSASESLLPADGSWNSLADQGFTEIEEANPGAGSLSELVPLAGNPLVVAPGQTFSLGALFNVAGSEDLQFEFFLNRAPLLGDFNAVGPVDSQDLDAWKAGFGDPYSGDDFLNWQRHAGSSSPASTPVIMHGVLRYETIGSAVANVPEPHSAALATLFAAAARFAVSRRRGASASPRRRYE